VALVGEEVRQVRCTTCDAEHEYKDGKLPASRKKKPAVQPPALAPARAAAGAGPGEAEGPAAVEAPAPIAGAAPAAPADPSALGAAPEVEAEAVPAPSPHAEISLHRRLIRATLPRIEGDTPARPIPEFTMHRAAPAGHGHRHGKPFRHGQGGGLHRQGGKGGFGQGRHGQGEVNGNTIGSRGGHGQRGAHGGHGPLGAHGPQRGHGGPHGPRPSRHGFGGKPPRGPKKH
jgi:ATP-dependent RNA helicase SUPV3L1/SUV3